MSVMVKIRKGGKRATVGEVRKWADGRSYQKTAQGWVPVERTKPMDDEEADEASGDPYHRHTGLPDDRRNFVDTKVHRSEKIGGEYLGSLKPPPGAPETFSEPSERTYNGHLSSHVYHSNEAAELAALADEYEATAKKKKRGHAKSVHTGLAKMMRRGARDQAKYAREHAAVMDAIVAHHSKGTSLAGERKRSR